MSGPDPRDAAGEGAGEGPARVRPYALVGGRTRAASGELLPVEAIAVTVGSAPPSGVSPECLAIARHCETPSSVAELSAHLRLPVGVVRVLVADLAAAGALHVHLPDARAADGSVDRALLERVLAGLQSL